MAETFPEIFMALAQASATAPGTVNLLGTHTDYNDGFALVIATPLMTSVEVAESRDELNHFHAFGMGKTITCPPEGDIPEGFAGSLFRCLVVLQEQGFPVSPVSVLVRSNVPPGAGLAGSAALQVAMMRALRQLFRFGLDDVAIARLAQRAEMECAGNCGLMDHMASSLADPGRMLFIDARSLDRQFLPLPEGAELVVIASGIPAPPAGSWYIERRGECEEACRRLPVAALRDVTEAGLLSPLPPLLRQRARHVVTENARVVEASGGVSAHRFGELMNDSHASLRDDYQVSISALDLLAEVFREDPRTYGARLAGAGFGGACAALVEKGSTIAVAGEVLARYRQQGGDGLLLMV